MDKPTRLRPDTRPRSGQVMWRAGQPRCRVRRGGGAGPRLRDLPPALTRQSPTREPRNYSGSVGLVRRLVPGWRRPSSPPVSGAGRCCSPMRALTTSTTPARVGIARCSGLGWRWAVATFSGCRHWGRRHPWTRTAPSGRAGPQHQQARPPQRPWRYAGAPDGRRPIPGKTAVRTALSPRYLIRPPWLGAATRDENRVARPSSAFLGAREPVDKTDAGTCPAPRTVAASTSFSVA